MNMLSMYFALWVTQDMGGKDIHYSFSLSASVVLAAVTMPLIGSLSDRLKRRVPFLVVFTLISVAFIAAIKISGGLIPALFFFAVANFAYLVAMVPYDALLPEVSRGVNIGRVSGLGVALGYFGSIAGLLMVKPFVDSGGRAAAFIPTAVLFLIFSLPAFVFIKEYPQEKPKGSSGALRREFKKIAFTLMHTRRYPGVLRFMAANLIYSDAVNTVIVYIAVNASKVIVMDDKEIRTFMIASTIFAALGSFAAGKLTDKWGPRKTLMRVLGLWAFTTALACVSPSRTLFWAVGPLAGISLGSTWVSSRAVVAGLAPERKRGELFGLYNLGGKFGFVIGPLVWGGIVWALEPWGLVRYRAAILSLFVFIIASMFVLKGVPEGRRLRRPA
jgi:UMF1 family MFS transporter